jgi:hypothetical protein
MKEIDKGKCSSYADGKKKKTKIKNNDHERLKGCAREYGWLYCYQPQRNWYEPSCHLTTSCSKEYLTYGGSCGRDMNRLELSVLTRIRNSTDAACPHEPGGLSGLSYRMSTAFRYQRPDGGHAIFIDAAQSAA